MGNIAHSKRAIAREEFAATHRARIKRLILDGLIFISVARPTWNKSCYFILFEKAI
jgi:hypothetical protein